MNYAYCHKCHADVAYDEPEHTVLVQGDIATVEACRAAPRRIVEGTRYTQADAADRDQVADFAQALTNRSSHDVLMALHAMGYDVSTARVRTVR